MGGKEAGAMKGGRRRRKLGEEEGNGREHGENPVWGKGSGRVPQSGMKYGGDEVW